LISRVPEFRIKLPGRQAVLRKLDFIVTDSILSHVDVIHFQKLPYSVSVDIATTKGMKSSYLAVMITYMTKELAVKTFAFDLVELKGRHTAVNLKRCMSESLSAMNLSIEQASTIITDGASNMSAAFK